MDKAVMSSTVGKEVEPILKSVAVTTPTELTSPTLLMPELVRSKLSPAASSCIALELELTIRGNLFAIILKFIE